MEDTETAKKRCRQKERFCKYPGCCTKLSIYNNKKYCFVHGSKLNWVNLKIQAITPIKYPKKGKSNEKTKAA